MGAFRRRVGRLALKLFGGWTVEGALPKGGRAVVIAAPHTTNWDLPIMLGVAYVLDADLNWLGKDAIFKGPFGGFFRWLGGIPVDRSSSNDVVSQVVEEFARRKSLLLAIAPEGTRKATPHWKSGFYYMALEAKVPILLGFLDYQRKAGGILGVVTPTGNLEVDLKAIGDHYANVAGKYPENFKNISFRPKS